MLHRTTIKLYTLSNGFKTSCELTDGRFILAVTDKKIYVSSTTTPYLSINTEVVNELIASRLLDIMLWNLDINPHSIQRIDNDIPRY